MCTIIRRLQKKKIEDILWKKGNEKGSNHKKLNRRRRVADNLWRIQIGLMFDTI